MNNDDISWEEIIKEVTEYTVYAINHKQELYELVKDKRVGQIKKICHKWAEDHHNEFGDLFQTELDLVDWKEVKRKI